MEIDIPPTPLDIIPTDNNEPPSSETQPNKRRRKKSIVWDHFDVAPVGAGCTRAYCKQCKKSFAYITGSKLAGTSHLKRHIALGICPVSRQKNQLATYTPGTKSGSATDPPKRRYRSTSGFPSIPFDQERCTHEIARMIILHEYPLHIVEHPGFINFVKTLQPQYNMVSFNTIQGDCVAIYLREKQSLLNLISEIPGRVSLTLDLGTSNQTIGYVFLTGHFIDGEWNLHRRLLNVIMVPTPDSDYGFNQAVVACLSDWHLESRLFTLTLDQSFSNETINGNLRGFLSTRNPHILNGQLLKGSCYARVLSRLAQDALGALGEIIRRIRESVKYVKTSDAHEEKFIELKQQLQVPSTKELIIDDQTKWDTTYHMLLAACELKEVFACLDTSDPDYRINPSIDDWKQVEILCTYLKMFFDSANILTVQTYPPSNIFYHEVSKILLELTHAAMSEDPFISNLTKPLKEKFDIYWKESFLVLAIAVVMDPRFKMKLVEFSFSRVFGEDAETWIRLVDDSIHELFLDYITLALPAPPPYVEEGIKTEAPQEGLPQDETSHEVLFPEVQALEVAHQEFHSQGALHQERQLQELPPQEVSHQETQLQELPSQEVRSEELCPQEAPLEETHPQVSLEETLPCGIPSQQEQLQEAHSHQEPLQHPHGVPPQEAHPQQEPLPEAHPHGVPPQEVQPHGGPPEEAHHHQGSLQETHHNGVSPQEVPIQETDHNAVPPQEAHPQVVVQEAYPQEEPMHEAHHHELHAQEAYPQEMPMQDAHYHEVPPQEAYTQEVLPQEAYTQEVLPQEAYTQEVPMQEAQHPELPPQEAYPQEGLPEEAYSQGMPQAEYSQEAYSQGMPQEAYHHGVPQDAYHHGIPQEVHNQDFHLMSAADGHQKYMGDGLSDFEVYISALASSQQMKSELDQYLEESLLPRVQEFDILGWWKLNKLKYPTLSRMASDILSIPVSTVAPDSVFHVKSKKIDNYRSSLRPVTMEALICAKDWLQYVSSSPDISNAIVKIEF